MNDFQVEDNTLLEQIKGGSREAFIEIYNRYWEKLYSAAYIRLKSKETAEDILQDIFIRLWTNRETNAIKNLNSYLSTSLKYEILDYFRDTTSHKRHNINATEHLKEVKNSTEEKLSFDELYNELQKELELLPEKCRLVFELSRNKGLSNKEISQELDISPKTVEFHMSKAIKILRISLKDYTFLVLLISQIF